MAENGSALKRACRVPTDDTVNSIVFSQSKYLQCLSQLLHAQELLGDRRRELSKSKMRAQKSAVTVRCMMLRNCRGGVPKRFKHWSLRWWRKEQKMDEHHIEKASKDARKAREKVQQIISKVKNTRLTAVLDHRLTKLA